MKNVNIASIYQYVRDSSVEMLGYMQNIKSGVISNEYIFPYFLFKKGLGRPQEALRIVKEV